MKVVSWNVNSVRVRYPLITQCVETLRPNIIALQETKVSDAEFPHHLLEETHPYRCWVGNKGRNGVAILSDHPITLKQQDLPMDGHQPGRFLHVVIGGVHIVNVYAPNGESLTSEKFQYKAKFYQDLTDYLAPYKEEPLLLMGDFNIARRPNDSYAPQRFKRQLLFSAQERVWLRTLVHEMIDIGDIVTEGRATTDRYTWWDYRTPSFPEKGLRIDAIFATVSVGSLIRAYGVLQCLRQEVKPSDHAPVWCYWE